MKEIFKKEGIIFLQPENYEDAVDEGKRMRNAVHYFYEHRARCEGSVDFCFMRSADTGESVVTMLVIGNDRPCSA